jgi:hypothetical protein
LVLHIQLLWVQEVPLPRRQEVTLDRIQLRLATVALAVAAVAAHTQAQVLPVVQVVVHMAIQMAHIQVVQVPAVKAMQVAQATAIILHILCLVAVAVQEPWVLVAT